MAFGIVHIRSAQSHNIDFFTLPPPRAPTLINTHTCTPYTHTYNFLPPDMPAFNCQQSGLNYPDIVQMLVVLFGFFFYRTNELLTLTTSGW